MGAGRWRTMLSLCSGLLLVSATLVAQTPPPPRGAASVADGDVVKRGEAVFSRHCPICHLGRPSSTRPFVGKNLRGLLKNATPAREAAVRESIRIGNDRMPGYQHALTPGQVDELIAYLKTYN